MCNNEINLRDHLEGLVVDDKHFICKTCCVNSEKEVLTNFVKEKNVGTGSVRPIMLWLWGKR